MNKERIQELSDEASLEILKEREDKIRKIFKNLQLKLKSEKITLKQQQQTVNKTSKELNDALELSDDELLKQYDNFLRIGSLQLNTTDGSLTGTTYWKNQGSCNYDTK